MTRPPREPDLESGYPSPTIVDSRRLMGPNLMHAGLGAVLDVSLDDATPERNASLLTAWHERVSWVTDMLAWPDADTTQRIYPGGASLFVHAPIDQLMTATEVCESSWVFAEQAVDAVPGSSGDVAMASLLAFSLAETRTVDGQTRPLAQLWDEAQRLGLNLTFDDTIVSVGSGIGSQSWPIDAIPAIGDIDWPALRDVPIVLVTGSNGKTTVVRMVAAMASAAGHTVGYTCTDGVWIGGVQVERGDWSGPAGARRVLQDPSVTLAVLETARGGLLRRGLAVQRASAAGVVTLSPDHFGDYGITDLRTLADAKMVVSRAVQDTGLLVINDAIPELREAVASYPGRVAAVSASPTVRLPMTDAEIAAIPATLGGTARHNVLNAAMALMLTSELGLGPAALDGLRHFGADPRENMGRLMRYAIGGVTIVVDYAHNPQSVEALIEATRQLPATRRAISLGTGGDRDDVALQAIARAAFDSGIIDHYIAKEMPKFLRGRAPGSISGVLLAALRDLGVPQSRLASAPDDMSAVRGALQWAHAGDLLLLAVHDDRDEVLALLARLTESGWHAGEALPA